jgi:hypothetical protein
MEWFTIPDGAVHEKWQISSGIDNTGTLTGPPELFENPWFIDDLTDSEPEAVKKMYGILRMPDIPE